MGGRRRHIGYYVRTFTELDVVKPRPATNAITEGDLFRGYSGLVDRHPGPRPTAETVRRSLAAADDVDDVDGPGSRDEVPAADVADAPAP